MKKTTFDDIAREMGVSKGLVSLALNNKYGVSNEMRSKIVLKAIEMGYKVGESRKGNFVKRIVLLVKRTSVLTEEFWRDVIIGIEQGCSEKNILLNIISWDSKMDDDTFTMELLDFKCQGVILLNQCPERIVHNIAQLKIPMVLLDLIRVMDGDYDTVMANNYSGGMMAANCFINNGHRNLICFGNKEYSYSFLQRYLGFKDAVSKAALKGIEIKSLDLVEPVGGAYLSEEYYPDDDHIICSVDLLRRHLTADGRYTALFCLNDAVLKKALQVLQDMGRRVPEDISLISCDNTSVSVAAHPPVTSIDVPKKELGMSAINLLIEKTGGRREVSVTLELNTHLIERESVRKVAGVAVNGR